MNKLTILFITLLSFGFFTGYSQAGMDLTVTIKDTKGKAMANAEVSLTETVLRKVLKARTDAYGKVGFSVREGKVWQLDILEIRNFYLWQFLVPEKGISTQTRTLTYDVDGYKRKMRPPVDRSKLKLDTIEQTVTSPYKIIDGECIIKIQLKRKNNAALIGFPVQLTCYKLNKAFITKTNRLGEAAFKVPDNNEYELDLEGIESYNFIDVGPGKMVYYNNFIFEPMNFKEIVTSDTITQVLPSNPQGTSARYALKLFCIYDNGGGPVVNKTIYLKEKQGAKVFKATTDDKGIAYFMLPQGKTYIYPESNSGFLSKTVEVIDLTRAFGVGGGHKYLIIPYTAEPRVLPSSLKLAEIDNDKFKQWFKEKGINITKVEHKSIPYYADNVIVYEDKDSTIGIKTGFLLTTGSAANAIGPNDQSSMSTAHSHFLVSDLPASVKGTVGANFDACILTVEFIPDRDNITITYVFASEEYPEYTTYDDISGIFLEGEGMNSEENLSLLPKTGTNVSVAEVNHLKNASFYVSNDNPSKESFKTWQYDGFSKRFVLKKKAIAGKSYKITMIITDRLDNIYDSGLFVGIESK